MFIVITHILRVDDFRLETKFEKRMYRLLSLVVCLFCLVTRLKAESRNLVYFEEEKTWLQAKKTCLECGGELVDWDESVSEIVSKSDVKNTITWIGNYTVENPWIKEEGCIRESDLTDKSYNFIYNNNPEFCSRTCKTDQMFALKEERCYCIENYNALTILPCNETSNHQQLNITVYSIGYVYNCSFEKDSCTNTSYGEETMGLTWRRTKDNDARNIGNVGVVNKGHYLLLEYLTTEIMNKARVLISLNLTKTYFCLTFKYYIDHSGSIEIFVNEPNVESHIAWKSYGNKGHMWYLASLDIKGHSDMTIEIYGSLEDKDLYYKTSTVAIDEMTILPGSCNKEKRLDCGFDNECEWNQESAWKIVKEKNGNFYLKTADDNRPFELNGFGSNRHIATTYCLQFDYKKYNWDGSFYVNNNQTQLLSAEGYTKEWERKEINIQANHSYYIKFNGSRYSGNLGIDNISLRSGSCGQDTMMVVESFDNWEKNGNLTVKKCYDGENCLVFDNSKMHKRFVYKLSSPFIRITSTTMFCLTFYVWTYLREADSISFAILTKSSNKIYWRNPDTTNWEWYQHAISFERLDDFKIVIQVIRKSNLNWWYNVKIKNLKLMAGICERGTNNVSKGPMCPVVDSSDSSRLSVGFCSKMKKQAFICQFNYTTGSTEMCKNGTHIENVTEIITSTTAASGITTTTTLLKTNDISNSFPTSNKESSITLTKTTISNLNLTDSPSYLKNSESKGVETGLLIVTSVLSAIVLFFVLLTIYLCLKIRRNQESVKEKENLERVYSVQNRAYEVESSGSSYIQTPTNNDYELASTVKDQLEQRKNKYIYKNESVTNMPKNELESDYQNCDNFTPPKRYDSQVYQETEEGDYDHLGESDKRRMDLNCEGDNLYDHGQTIKSRNNGIYDTTKPETVDDYFVLEPENGASRESGIYDHTK